MAGQSFAAGSTVELETSVDKAPKDRVIVLGLGAAVVPDYEGSEDMKGVPVPLFKLIDPAGWYVELIGTTLRANLVPNEYWSAGPQVRYRGERKDVDNNKVDRMEKVDAAIELGGFVGFAYEGWHAKIDLAVDASSSYDGYLVGLNGGYTWNLKPWKFTVSGFTTYADENYMETYFGVDARDAASSGLRTFDADGGFKDVGTTLVGSYQFNKNWGAICAARYTLLVGDAADSPLVDDEGSESQFLLAALITYMF
jgi:outer membrane protein